MNDDGRRILLGVDGGGSSTVAWLGEASGRILARAETGPSNIKAVGESAALSAIDSAIVAAISDARDLAGVEINSIAVACLGLAGFDRPEDRAVLERWNAARGWAETLVLVNDGELVLAAGTPEGWGLAVIAGTGSIVVGRSAAGRSARAGGWGHIFGDEGSGYATAVAALRRVASIRDGRIAGEWSSDPLCVAVCEAVGVSDPSGLVSAIYAPGFDRTRIAAIVPAIVRAAHREPAIDRELLVPAGRALAETARAVAVRLGLPRTQLPVAMAGGFLLSADVVAASLRSGLGEAGYDIVTRRVDDPVRGALILAMRALFSEPTDVEPSDVLVVDGAVDRPARWTYRDLAAFGESEQVRDVSRFPSRKNGDGVSLEAILARVGPHPDADYLTLHASRDDFHVSVPLSPIRAEGVVVYRVDDGPLPREQGGPIRFLIRDPSACHTSELDDCANVKYLDRIELSIKKGLDTRPRDDAAHEALHAQ
jgi:N-acetylglucosamine kinase-like BadF-type ATPase